MDPSRLAVSSDLRSLLYRVLLILRIHLCVLGLGWLSWVQHFRTVETPVSASFIRCSGQTETVRLLRTNVSQFTASESGLCYQQESVSLAVTFALLFHMCLSFLPGSAEGDR